MSGSFHSKIASSIWLIVSLALTASVFVKILYPTHDLAISLSRVGVGGYLSILLADFVLAFEVWLLTTLFFPVYHLLAAAGTVFAGMSIIIVSLYMWWQGVTSNCGCAGSVLRFSWGSGHIMVGLCILALGIWWWYLLRSSQITQPSEAQTSAQ